MAEYKYPLDNESEHARKRLSLLEAMLDPWTIRNLEKVGVGEGWSCLEIAGGGGSIAKWLRHQVRDSGYVLATDLEPRFLEGESNLEVKRHDILHDPLPAEKFNLVHARAVLAFLPQPVETISKMVAALKPDGWLLLEEPDMVSAVPDPSMTAAAKAISKKGWDAWLSYIQSRGANPWYGRQLYRDVSINGIADLHAEGMITMSIGGTPSAMFWKITLEQVKDQILLAGLLTLAELNDYLCLLESPEYRWFTPVAMSVLGRRIITK